MNSWTDQQVADVIEISGAVRYESAAPDLIVEEYSQWDNTETAVVPSWNYIPEAAA